MLHETTRTAAMDAELPSADQRIVGWREWLSLPDLGIPAIKAKLDTGARSSALHVEAIEEFRRDGVDWLRFQLNPRSRRRRPLHPRWIEAPLSDRREVTDSSGSVSLRPFIRTDMLIAGQRYEIEINLTSRRDMRFPMLLGRTAIRGRLCIDSALSYSLGKPTADKTS